MSPHLDGPVESVAAPSPHRPPETEAIGPETAAADPVSLAGPALAGPAEEMTSLLTDELAAVLTDELRFEIDHRLADVEALQRYAGDSASDANRYVQGMLGFRAWAHAVHLAIHAPPAAEGPEPQHER